MSIGVLMPTEKETEKGRAAKTSMVYKCIMLKYECTKKYTTEAALKITKRCPRAQIKNMCAASVAKL